MRNSGVDGELFRGSDPAFLGIILPDQHRFRGSEMGQSRPMAWKPESSLKMLIFPNNCQFGSKFWIRPDEADAFVVNTHPKCSPGTRMEPLAQTWHVKMW